MVSSLRSVVLLMAGAVAAQQATVPTVHMPLHLRYGTNHKVATDLFLPYQNQSIEVCYDLGSPDFWLFESGSTMNWGCRYLDCQGPCNVSVPNDWSYDPSLSTTATPKESWKAAYGYGGGLAKKYTSDAILNDTFHFTNAAGLSTEVPNVRVALTQYLQQRIGDDGSCSPVPEYTHAILGVAPYFADPNPQVQNTTGPSFRQNLLEQGLISAPVQSMWFEKAPSEFTDPLTGSALLGGIDTSKYEGPLVRIPRLLGGYSENEYYTYAANFSHNGVTFKNAARQEESDVKCLIDSGAVADGIDPADQQQFFNVTGLREHPDRTGGGQALSWPGACDSIPADSFMEYSFIGLDPSQTVVIKMPMRNYARYQDPGDEKLGWCTMAINLRTCGLSAPFMTAAFFAADDEAGEMALAQGGVAPRGSGIDHASVVLRIP
ncbi:acid protease [Polyplosphaeria fusca]|uniref:Acid protease n=1 Tax=Polyplosphaeria fusca TaxID=682080 RepID=A0A9P4QTF8_9PLEO|nr:acid protease [Polyplosphaeria fusca]